jgi:methylated-DNA-protein-cysteine methyltransferase-like protein
MNTFDKIYAQVRRIPRGKVATYGQIATLAGNPHWSQIVGYALHGNPSPETIPCHRVVNRFGGTAASFAFGGGDRQRELLEAEGITFRSDGTLDLKQYLWNGE